MKNRSRREFLATSGHAHRRHWPGTGFRTGLSTPWAVDAAERLTLGDKRTIEALMQDTPAEKPLPILVEKIRADRT
jgi:hypothetical protein